MRNRLSASLFTLLFLVLAGCAWVHQDAVLKLTPAVAPSRVGDGVTIAVRVVDRRPGKILGYRGLDSKNAAITTEQDVAALFREKILEGLAQKGFTAVPYTNPSGRVLTVEVREIQYSTDMEFWKGTIQAKATLRAAFARDGVPYDQTYVGERRESAVEAPRASTNERLINGALSDVVQRLFEDERLMLFLAN